MTGNFEAVTRSYADGNGVTIAISYRWLTEPLRGYAVDRWYDGIGYARITPAPAGGYDLAVYRQAVGQPVTAIDNGWRLATATEAVAKAKSILQNLIAYAADDYMALRDGTRYRYRNSQAAALFAAAGL